MARKAKGTGLRRRVSSEDLERLNIAIARGVAERLRVHCARERVSLSLAIERALTAYLKA